MRYEIQLIAEGTPYMVLPPFGGDESGLLEVAQSIIRANFDGDSNMLRQVAQGERMPNEVRIVNAEGRTMASWSVVEEHRLRVQKRKGE